MAKQRQVREAANRVGEALKGQNGQGTPAKQHPDPGGDADTSSLSPSSSCCGSLPYG